MIYKGGCHCGKIAFEVEGELKEIVGCNCSICTDKGYLHWMVAPNKLHLQTPESNLATYTFKTGKYKHNFCPVCGCSPFVRADDGVAVNVRCLEGVDPSSLKLNRFDGRSL